MSNIIRILCKQFGDAMDLIAM